MQKMTCNNPKLDLVNINAYIKFAVFLSIVSQDIERIQKFCFKPRAINLVQVWEKLCVTIPS